MVPYNASFMDNATGFLPIMKGVNDNTNGLMMGVILFFIFLVLLISFSKFDMKDALLGATFIVSLLAGAAFGAGLLAAWTLTIPVTFMLIALFIKLWGDS